MRDKLPSQYKEIIDLMQNLLNFNPFFRMSAYEALKCKIFDSVRDVKKEKVIG